MSDNSLINKETSADEDDPLYLGEIASIAALKEDKSDGKALIYYVTTKGRVRRVKPADMVKEMEKEIDDNIEAERYLKDDPIAAPDPEHIEAIEDLRIGPGWVGRETETNEYIKSLRDTRAELWRKIKDFEELELRFQAGLLEKNDPAVEKIVSSVHVCTLF